jgi:hypothetical protein
MAGNAVELVALASQPSVGEAQAADLREELDAKRGPNSPTAWPPTRRYLASAPFNAVSRSRKSGLHRLGIRASVLSETELPHQGEPIDRSHRGPLVEGVLLHLGVDVVATEDARVPFDTSLSSPFGRVAHRRSIAFGRGSAAFRRSRGPSELGA